jgi:hypothetical protein
MTIPFLDNLQNRLNYSGCVNRQFTNDGMGKIGTTGFLIGLVGGLHLGIFLTFLLLCTYVSERHLLVKVVVSCIHHLGEYLYIHNGMLNFTADLVSLHGPPVWLPFCRVF